MTAAQIRDAARLVGADATAENVLDRTGQVAEIWVAGFIAALEVFMVELGVASPDPAINRGQFVVLNQVARLLGEAHAAAETVGTP
jgi:hypothetical protein